MTEKNVMLSIAETIRDSLDDMTRSERQVATYYLGHTGDFAFSTLDRIAEAVDTSTTSVLRFCRRLGFSGFKDFQQSLREELRYQPRLPDKFHRSVMEDSGDKLLSHIITQDISCIDETFRGLSQDSIHQTVAAIGKARRVYTFGMKESYALAHYAYTRLLTVRPDVQVLQAGYNGEIESLLSMTPEDVCLVFLFYRYTWQSISILELLKHRKVPVILVTNEPCDAVKHLAQQLLLCRVDYGGIKNTAVAPVVLTDYLCSAVAAVRGDPVLEHMKQSEELFRMGSVLKE